MPPVVTISWRRCRRGCQSAVRRGKWSRTVIVDSWVGPGRKDPSQISGRECAVEDRPARRDLAQPTRGATRRRLAARTSITVAEHSIGRVRPRVTTRRCSSERRGPRRDPAGPSWQRAGQSSRSLGRPASSRGPTLALLGLAVAVAVRRLGLRQLPARPLQRGGLRRRVRLDQRTGDRRTRRAQLVHPLGHRGALVLQRDGVAVVVDAAERLVDLDELAVRQPPDDAGLDAVLEHRAVRPLQAEAPPVGHPVGDRRHDEQPDPARPRGGVQRDVEEERDPVVDRAQAAATT